MMLHLHAKRHYSTSLAMNEANKVLSTGVDLSSSNTSKPHRHLNIAFIASNEQGRILQQSDLTKRTYLEFLSSTFKETNIFHQTGKVKSSSSKSAD